MVDRSPGGPRPNSVPLPSTPTTSKAGIASSCPSSPLSQTRSRQRQNSTASNISRHFRRASRTFEESNLPEGFLSATGDFASTILPVHDANQGQHLTGLSSPQPHSYAAESPAATRRSSYGFGVHPPGPSPPQSSKSLATCQRASPVSDAKKARQAGPTEKLPGIDREANPMPFPSTVSRRGDDSSAQVASNNLLIDVTKPCVNGYHFPPKKPFSETIIQGLKAFIRYSMTPIGFIVVLYGLNVVAWGGMIFLLLCNAAPAMCHPSCSDINSSRRKWIEYDAQILNALFCVTGFGLAPWRLRDIYFLLKFRLGHDAMALRRLAGIHRGWLRLTFSDTLPSDLGPDSLSSASAAGPLRHPANAIPYPPTSIPDAPRTGQRAPPTRLWKLDFVIWMNASNTFLQCGLSAFMWGFNRYNRPSWAVGLFVAAACTVAALGGIMIFLEGRKVKGIEGVQVTDDDLKKLARDRELGIPHYNNIKDKKPKI